MESQLAKLDPHYVATGLGMAGIHTTDNVAAIIQDVIHELIDKKAEFSLMDAAEIIARHRADELAIEQNEKVLRLKERYKVLSELCIPGSVHKTQKQISAEMDRVIKELENLK